MSKILYIHPFGEHPSNNDNFYINKSLRKITIKKPLSYYSFIPMGLIGAINHMIKDSFKVKGINLPLKKTLYDFNFEHFIKDSKEYNIFLIDIHWYNHLKSGIEISKTIKKYHPNSKVIIGGMSATIFYKELIDLPSIDFIIKGDCEQPLLFLMKNISSKNKKNIPNLVSKEFDNPVEYYSIDIDKFDYADISWMEDSKPYIDMSNFWLLVAKGCPFNCKVCDGNKDNYPSIYKRNHLVIRSPDLIIDDIKKLENKTEYVNFSHDISLLSPEAQDKILRNKFNIGLYNEFFQLPSPELLSRLTASFQSLELVFTLISGSEKERKEYGKNFSNKGFLNLLEHLKTLQFNGGVIIYFTDYMISQLEVKELNKKKTQKLIKQIKKIYPYSGIELMPQLVDPMCVVKESKIGTRTLFNTYVQPKPI